MRKLLQTAVSPLLIYRIACGVGAAGVYADGVLADARMQLPDWVIGFRQLTVLLCLLILAASFSSHRVRRQIGIIVLIASLLLNAYSVLAAHATSLGLNEVLGCLLVLCVTSTIFHQIRLTVANIVGSAGINLFVASFVADPHVAFDKFALSVVVFATFFMILMVSNLHARSQRERSEQAANAWFDNSGDAMIYGDVATETVERANPMARQLFQTDEPKEIIEAIIAGILKANPQRSRADLLADAASATSMENVVAFTTATGQQFWGGLSIRRLQLGDEQLTLLRITDVSTRVAHEEALEAAREAAEQAVRTRTRFLANMSHEIRTPMNGVIGMTSLLLETPLNQQQQGFLNTIRTSGEALLGIINEILDFSKIDADQVQLEQQVFSLRDCAADALELMKPAADQKGLALELSLDQAVDGAFCGDVTRIRQVLVNLLSNAVKFTATGSVTLEVAPCGSELSAANIAFRVRDTGIGISSEQQRHLFDPFSQADASTTREYGGTGLGLSISRRLAELMDGDITVTSAPGAGSCFVFTLHVEPAASDPAATGAVSAPLRPLPIADLSFLVAEDNQVNQKVAVHMLKRLGVHTDVVSNGREAIEILQQRHYDVVFMDMQMPEVDGLEASTMIRQNLAQDQPYIIAMTANAMVEDREACISAGMSDFVAKPIRLEDLHAALSRALDNHRRQAYHQAP